MNDDLKTMEMMAKDQIEIPTYDEIATLKEKFNSGNLTIIHQAALLDMIGRLMKKVEEQDQHIQTLEHDVDLMREALAINQMLDQDPLIDEEVSIDEGEMGNPVG